MYAILIWKEIGKRVLESVLEERSLICSGGCLCSLVNNYKVEVSFVLKQFNGHVFSVKGYQQ